MRADSRVSFLHQLRDSPLALGPTGSGTLAVAQQLLWVNGLDEGDYRQVALEGDPAEALQAGEVDAVFRVGAADAPAIAALHANPGLRVMPFTRARAYSRHLPFLEALTLHAGSFSLSDNEPPTDLPLIAPAATLIARGDIHPALVQLLMQAVEHTHGEASLLAESGTFPSGRWLDVPLHPEAARYLESGHSLLQRYLPFWLANLLDRMKLMLLPLLALMLPMSRLLPPAYRWRMRRRVYQWYDEVQMIDNAVHSESPRWTLDACEQAVDEIEAETRRVDVPLSFYNELYSLRQHIELLRDRIAARRSGPQPLIKK